MKSAIAIIGRAPCWKEDLSRLNDLTTDFDVVAIGMDCAYEGNVDYFATYHNEEIEVYAKKRVELNRNTNYRIISHIAPKGTKVDVLEPYESPSGSSALLGALGAMKEGYTKVVLCGCPLQGKNDKNQLYESFQRGWKKHSEKVTGKVKSMSGWTAEFLGEPTKGWLNGSD